MKKKKKKKKKGEKEKLKSSRRGLFSSAFTATLRHPINRSSFPYYDFNKSLVVFAETLMDKEVNLPFKVEELAEAKSFQIGFRGAWFRCKIREISKRNGKLGHISEYYDFPDEKLKWTKLYQVPNYYVARSREKFRELMLRPCYPPIYSESQMPRVSEISEVAVIVDDTWKVGNLVDWWTTGCYWSGRIIQLFGEDKAKIELKQPPEGEGLIYDILLKDIRPSLDWSPECGWTVPTQDGDGHTCARLLKPINEEKVGQVTEAGQKTDELKSLETSEMRKISLRKKLLKEVKDTQETATIKDCLDDNMRNATCTDAASRQISVEPVAEVAETDLHSNCCQKYRTNEKTSLNSMRSDTLEAAIMDLEELVNKVKWIKAILGYGVSFSDSASPEWQFVDQHAAPSIMPKQRHFPL